MTTLYTVKPGLVFPQDMLKQILGTMEHTLFFAKLYDLDQYQLSQLVRLTQNSSVVDALLNEGGEHSAELQNYLVEVGYESLISAGDVAFTQAPPQGEILPELWKSLEVQVAQSIKDVAVKLQNVVGHMPGKEGQMLFQSMAVMNAKRPVLGDYKAYIHHAPKPDNLVILDVSGSMTESTVRTIVQDVVAMSYMANAHLAIVSDTTTHWEPGQYSVNGVLAAAEYWGTHYETLAPLFNRDWGVVVTIADYDSSRSALSAFTQRPGRVSQVLDISLVNKPTFLSEVVGILADEVRPLLIAADNRCCMR